MLCTSVAHSTYLPTGVFAVHYSVYEVYDLFHQHHRDPMGTILGSWQPMPCRELTADDPPSASSAAGAMRYVAEDSMLSFEDVCLGQLPDDPTMGSLATDGLAAAVHQAYESMNSRRFAAGSDPDSIVTMQRTKAETQLWAALHDARGDALPNAQPRTRFLSREFGEQHGFIWNGGRGGAYEGASLIADSELRARYPEDGPWPSDSYVCAVGGCSRAAPNGVPPPGRTQTRS